MEASLDNRCQKKRVQLNQIVKSQLPSYVQEDFPLVGEFLSQYYIGQEYKGGTVDLIQNIDSYIKLSESGNLIKSTSTTKYAGLSTSTIFVSNTEGFPENYGLIKINDEVITYESKTNISFVNCKEVLVELHHLQIQQIQKILFFHHLSLKIMKKTLQLII